MRPHGPACAPVCAPACAPACTLDADPAPFPSTPAPSLQILAPPPPPRRPRPSPYHRPAHGARGPSRSAGRSAAATPAPGPGARDTAVAAHRHPTATSQRPGPLQPLDAEPQGRQGRQGARVAGGGAENQPPPAAKPFSAAKDAAAGLDATDRKIVGNLEAMLAKLAAEGTHAAAVRACDSVIAAAAASGGSVSVAAVDVAIGASHSQVAGALGKADAAEGPAQLLMAARPRASHRGEHPGVRPFKPVSVRRLSGEGAGLRCCQALAGSAAAALPTAAPACCRAGRPARC